MEKQIQKIRNTLYVKVPAEVDHCQTDALREKLIEDCKLKTSEFWSLILQKQSLWIVPELGF